MKSLLLISIAPVVMLGSFIYKHDKNKESKKLLTKLFIFGILSTILTIILSSITESLFPILAENPENLNKIELIINVFIGVALIEEFSKWIMVYAISYNHHEFDEVYDSIVYTVFVSLGFACLENILYVFMGGIFTGIMRALLAVPGHACDGVIMGYFLGLAKMNQIKGDKTKEKWYILLSILCPTLAHGIYDYCLMTGDGLFIIIFFIFVIVLFVKCFKTVKKIAKQNKNMITNQNTEYQVQNNQSTTIFQQTVIPKKNYCPNCGTPVTSKYCTNCGQKNM